MLEAVGTERIEALCDAFSGYAAETYGGLKARFSPGYGDFALEIQREFLDILNASKTVGIVLSDGGVMIPEKSVTAVMGISRTNSRCHIEGCESCTKKNCRFRRNN